uniref:Uncharacterized protein n=1 Tax=Phlebotomus papatasi TaxID=29031 RepID=A0A240SY91_PHLPP
MVFTTNPVTISLFSQHLQDIAIVNLPESIRFIPVRHLSNLYVSNKGQKIPNRVSNIASDMLQMKHIQH